MATTTTTVPAVDMEIISPIEEAILLSVGGYAKLQKAFPPLIRRALDEVIDTARTGRLRLDQLEKTEKTYIGTKVEILFRALIGFPKGILDLEINGVDVDVKNTIGSTWMIPLEAIHKPCILISANERKAECNLGIFICRPEYFSESCNRDKKKSIPRGKFKYIHWLLSNYPYPENIWETVDTDVAKEIFGQAGGSTRLLKLFMHMQNIPISRNLIEGIAQQKDYMKRLRKNGGARDSLAEENIAVLWGGNKVHRLYLRELSLPYCTSNEFLAYRPKTEEEDEILAEYFK